MVLLKEFFEKVDFENKNQQMTKKHEKIPSLLQLRVNLMNVKGFIQLRYLILEQ